MENGDYIIFFDGVCNLCNRSVQFIITRDKKHIFKFAALQGEHGQAIRQQLGLHGMVPESVILLEGKTIYTESAAALRIARHLSGAWPLMYGFIIVPAFIRNAVYRFVARNRYRWFGKEESCWLPRPEWKSRFLD